MTLGEDGLRCIGCGDRFVREGSNVSEYCSVDRRPLVGGNNPHSISERVADTTPDSSDSDSKEGEMHD